MDQHLLDVLDEELFDEVVAISNIVLSPNGLCPIISTLGTGTHTLLLRYSLQKEASSRMVETPTHYPMSVPDSIQEFARAHTKLNIQ